jgi:hypothetical protein
MAWILETWIPAYAGMTISVRIESAMPRAVTVFSFLA